MPPHYFTPFRTTVPVDPTALNARLVELDDQIYAIAQGSGLENWSANAFLAGPVTGSPSAPTLRAIEEEDIEAALTDALTTAPPIGGTTPAAGTFTTLRANTSLLVAAGGGIVATFGNGAGIAHIAINGAAGNNRQVRFQSGGSDRWRIEASSASESGSNAGTHLLINRVDDAGNHLGTPISIFRDTGRVLFANEVEIDGTFNHDGANFGMRGATPGAAPTVTGSRASGAALVDLLTKLADQNHIVDGTSA